MAILVTAIISFAYGITTIKYRVFPYYAFDYMKNKIDRNVTPYSSYYLQRKSFFEAHGVNASVVMVGDSITDGAEWSELFPEVSISNRGIGGDTTAGVLNRIDSILGTNAKKVFLLIGFNDLRKDVPIETVFSNYIEIVRKLLDAEMTPYIQSTILARGHYARINKKIKILNSKLKAYAESKDLVFIDLNGILAASGNMSQDYTNDGVHLNGNGYAAWKSVIDKYIQLAPAN